MSLPRTGPRTEPRELAGTMRGPHGMPAVVVVEEGMREGLQIEDTAIPVAARIRLLDALSATGLRRIVVGSFVSPKWTPQMAHVEEVVRGFSPAEGVQYTALALNEKGRRRRAGFVPPLTVDTEVPATLVHLCDVFVRRNANCSQVQEIDAWPAAVAEALAADASEAQVGVNAAWGSNWLGPFSHDQRMAMLERQVSLWREAGLQVRRVFLGDPMGWNLPQDVACDLAEITRRWPSVDVVHLHLHNTRGLVPASVYAALTTLSEAHTLVLDASIGGMAGCPYCGNGRAAQLMPTEDLVHLLQESGYTTGVDLDALVEAAALAEEVVGHPLYGHVSKAGPRPHGDRLFPMDLPFIETLDQAQHFRLGPVAHAGSMSPWSQPITSPARSNP